MTYSSSHHPDCSFVSTDGVACKNKSENGDGFCEHHLWALTRENVKKKIVEIVLGTVYSDPAEVTERARFIDDLGADSLEMVALVMDVEEAFNLTIPDRKAETLSTVGQVVDHVTDVLMANNTPLPYEDKAVAEAADRRARRFQQSEKSQNQILESDLFRRYYELLGLEPEKVGWLYRWTVHQERIYKVTPIPDLDKSGGIRGVNVLFLGKDRIYHFDLRPDFMGFEWAYLDDLTLTYEIEIDGERNVSKVVVRSSSRDALGLAQSGARRGSKQENGKKQKKSKMRESLRAATFEFEGDEVEGAMDFLSRFLTNAGGNDERVS